MFLLNFMDFTEKKEICNTIALFRRMSMNVFYEWLYDHYAQPQMDEGMLPQTYQKQKEEWLAIADTLSPDDRLLFADLLESLRCHWGTLSFSYGMQAGLMLAGLKAEKPVLLPNSPAPNRLTPPAPGGPPRAKTKQFKLQWSGSENRGRGSPATRRRK